MTQFTDPRWNPSAGGLPVHDTWRWLPPCGPGSVGTITPPPKAQEPPEYVSPALKARLDLMESVIADLADALDDLGRMVRTIQRGQP